MTAARLCFSQKLELIPRRDLLLALKAARPESRRALWRSDVVRVAFGPVLLREEAQAALALVSAALDRSVVSRHADFVPTGLGIVTVKPSSGMEGDHENLRQLR